MIPYAVKCGEVDHRCLKLWRAVIHVVNAMPEKPARGPGLTCHDVCDHVVHSAGLGLDLRHVRGHFGFRRQEGTVNGKPHRVTHMKGSEHSWLVVRDHPEVVIIDPYPVAVASGPLLVSLAGTLNPWRFYYCPDPASELAADLEKEMQAP